MERKISLLQEFVAVSRYARWLDDEGRRENWGDSVLRYVDFMNRHTAGQFESVLYRQVLPAIEDHAVMPSMRALMTAGPALEREGLAAFNCFHGDTKYMTVNGLRTFAETVGTTQKVLAGDGIWRDAVVRCYGKQPLNRVTLRPGSRSRTSVRLEFLVTPDHRWITQAGVVTDLKLGDTVPFNAVTPPEFNVEDFIRGFGFGDGTIDDKGHARIRLCGDKAKYLGVFQCYGHMSEMYPPSCSGDPLLVFHRGHFFDWKELPEVPTYWWMAGYIAADGAAGGVTPNICTQNPEACDYLRQNLPYGGYAVVGHTEYTGPTNYGPRSSPLQKIGIRDEIDFRVVAIENMFACEEVYCVEEPVTQSFTLEGGVLTGNCAFVAINHKRKFAEALYLLMSGTGVGFSCERQEIQHLPTVPLNLQPCDDIITVGDSKDGWAKAYRKLVSCLYDGDIPNLDYSNIRPAGARLKIFGGRASGGKVFRRLCEYTVTLFKKAKGRKLNSLEVHDLMCTIGEIVVVGGVRRSALISLSNLSDLRMREAKTGQWYTENPQRALANNSVAYTEKPNVEIFMEEWLSLIRSKSGERGIFNREAAQRQAAKHGRRPADYPYSTNPCGEILLRDRGLCNLTEVVIRPDDTLESLTHKVSIATILGTLQSTITNFGFVDEEWKKNAEMERLLGVSLTGIYDHPIMSGKKGKDSLIRWLKELHEVAWKVNQEWSEILGIAPSAAITCVKPSGCQKESTLLITAEGVLTLGEIGDVLGPRWQDHSLSVRSSFGMPDSTKFYVNGKAPTVVLTMASGLTLESTRNHRYQMFTGDQLVWVEADEIEVGTCLPYLVDTHSGGSRQSFVFVQGVGNAQTITQPTFLTADLAWLLGLYYGDGSTHRKGLRISGSFRKEEALRKAARIFKDVFDIDCILYPRTNGDNNLDLYANSTELVHWFTANGVRKEASHELTIPECVRRSPADVLSSFIDGFWHADGCTGSSNSRTFCTVSRTFAEQLVVCLRATGTDASMREMPPTASSWGERMRYWVNTKKGRAGAIEKSPSRVSFRELDAVGLTTLTPDFVASISYGECETFDIEVPEGNEYLANTYISHNTVSQLVDSASGIHPRHSAYYLRTVRLDKKDPMCAFMSAAGVYSEDALGREDTTAVFYFPVKSPEGAVLRDGINALEHLALWSIYHEHWCDHNPSITITVRDHEWFSVGAWVYENFDKICGISFLPHSDHVYQQAPYIEVTKEQYDDWVAQHPVPEVDWALLSGYEKEDNTVSSQTLACQGNVCEIL